MSKVMTIKTAQYRMKWTDDRTEMLRISLLCCSKFTQNNDALLLIGFCTWQCVTDSKLSTVDRPITFYITKISSHYIYITNHSC